MKDTLMTSLTMRVNARDVTVQVTPDMPLLWVLRDVLHLTGTKFGCGIAMCGACTVLVDGHPVRSCVTPAATLEGQQITTIEGLSHDATHPVQQAWIEQDVPQCGYCQSGQIMTTVSLLSRTANPTDGDIDEALRGNICRCGTYNQIRSAVHRAAAIQRGEKA